MREPDADWNRRERQESELQRLDRNFNELLQELRVAQTGVQILFAFLVTLPFTQRFATVTGFQKDLYLVALIAALLLVAVIVALFLIVDVVTGVPAAFGVSLAVGVWSVFAWYVIPLRLRRRGRRGRRG